MARPVAALDRLFALIVALEILALPGPARAESIELGTSASSIGVSASGELQYSVPLWLPPGTAGMTPRLAIAYGHRTGETLLGYGWNLAGLSVITRCGQSLSQDGALREVKLDALDKYCLVACTN